MFFYHTLYMRFEKYALNAWYEKRAFYHPLKSLMLTNYNPRIEIVFSSKRTFNARSGKRMFYKLHVSYTLLDVRKTCVNERTLNMCYSIYTFTTRFKERMLHTFLCKCHGTRFWEQVKIFYVSVYT